jgi:hypothetical protein
MAFASSIGRSARRTIWRKLCHEFSDLTFGLYLAGPTAQKLKQARARCDIPPVAIRNRLVVEAATMASLGDWDFRPLLARLEMPALVLEAAEQFLSGS